MKWTDEENAILVANYGKYPIETWEHLIPKNRTAIQKRAQVIGIKGNHHISQKKFTINYNYFSEPNIENCYWAGFIAADGCLTQGKKENDKGLKISLSNKDLCILEQFKTVVNYNGNIKRDAKYCHLGIYGIKQWHLDLNKYWNITTKKSLTLEAPNLTEINLQLSYIIGLIDGDGSIYRTKNNDLWFNICGTENNIKWVADILHSLEDAKYKPFTLRQNGNSIQNKSISCHCNRAKILLQELEKVKVPWRLPRKWNKINE